MMMSVQHWRNDTELG